METLSTPPAQMTDAELIETVIERLTAQGTQAMHEGRCVYRTPDDRGCGVGVLLPDEMAREADGSFASTIDSVYGNVPGLAEWLGIPDEETSDRLILLVDIQCVHDSKTNWSEDGFLGADRMRNLLTDSREESTL